MTLEIKQLKSTAPYLLGGVQKITDKTEYGDGRFAITIFDRRIFVTSCFAYVKDVKKEKYYVKMGKWVGEEDERRLHEAQRFCTKTT